MCAPRVNDIRTFIPFSSLPTNPNKVARYTIVQFGVAVCEVCQIKHHLHNNNYMVLRQLNQVNVGMLVHVYWGVQGQYMCISCAV